MNRLEHTDFLHGLTGRIFHGTYDAWRTLLGVVPATDQASGVSLKQGVSP